MSHLRGDTYDPSYLQSHTPEGDWLLAHELVPRCGEAPAPICDLQKIFSRQWNGENVNLYPPMLTGRGSREQFYILVNAVIGEDVGFDIVSLFKVPAASGKRADITIIEVGHDKLMAHQGEGNRHSMVTVTMSASTGGVQDRRSPFAARQVTSHRGIRHLNSKSVGF